MRLSIASLTIIPIVPLVVPSPESPVWLLDYSHRCDCPSNTTATSPFLWRQLCWKLYHFYICFSQSSLASDVTTPPRLYQNQLYLHAAIRNPCPLTSCLDSIPHKWQRLPLNMLLFPWLLLLSLGFYLLTGCSFSRLCRPRVAQGSLQGLLHFLKKFSKRSHSLLWL